MSEIYKKEDVVLINVRYCDGDTQQFRGTYEILLNLNASLKTFRETERDQIWTMGGVAIDLTYIKSVYFEIAG